MSTHAALFILLKQEITDKLRTGSITSLID